MISALERDLGLDLFFAKYDLCEKRAQVKLNEVLFFVLTSLAIISILFKVSSAACQRTSNMVIILKGDSN